ncbi:MAG TPA: universal stress protein [Solirubrobacteraceae bacterium]|nr:universal stress protein [Solirubrobacteraceae bacterium]
MNVPVGPVIIAYDGSAAAREAITKAAVLMHSCRFLVVSVWEEGLAYAAMAPTMQPDAFAATPAVDPGAALDLDRSRHDYAEQVSREGADLARSLGLDAEPLALPDAGDVSSTILDAAREHRASAIIVGSRGLSGLRSRLEGSTSKGVLKHAPCPVFVAHAPDKGD